MIGTSLTTMTTNIMNSKSRDLDGIENSSAKGTSTTKGKYDDPFYEPWVAHSSALLCEPSTFGARTLRDLYPNHSIVLFSDETGFSILEFPDAVTTVASPPDVVSCLSFAPFSRRSEEIPGTLEDDIKFGCYNLKWDNHNFLVYVVQYRLGYSDTTLHYLLYEGPEDRSRALLLAAAAWKKLLHKEISVFDHGKWTENRGLWEEVQKANWDDVILKQEFKDALRKDVNGFYESERLYKRLALPWKRGIILRGPPGNGKTISMKAIMKDCWSQGRAPLYVKSFEARPPWGDEYAMGLVFKKAREMSPCVVVFEDLDSLINDKNRSYFLNQLDGLEGNDGLLVVGSTNHFEKLDPALSGRPSRFDRKYTFENPNEEERTLYAKYWQNKLRVNEDIVFPDRLMTEFVALTANFSFAYLKEVFVSALVLLLEVEGDKEHSFATLVRAQTKALQEQIQQALSDPPSS